MMAERAERAEQAEQADEDVDAEATAETGAGSEAEAATDEQAHDAHLADVEEGAGCTEIWEHLSEQREEE